MSTEATTRLNGTGYAAETVTKPPGWHGLVAWDLLFNNLTTGLFLAAALGDLLAPEEFTPVAKAAYPIALVFLVIDLACLVFDLGDPLRFHHMLRVFKPTSPMSLGTWCLTIYSLPLTVAAGLSLWPAITGWEGPGIDLARRTAVVLGLLPALGSAMYKGVLLSTNSQPGWRDGRWLGGYLTNSALLLGCAELLTLSVLLGRESATTVLQLALAALVVLNTLVLCLLFGDLRAVLVRMYSLDQLWRLALLAFGVGAAAPLGLILVGGGPAVLLAAVLCLLIGALAVRFAIIRMPHARRRLPC
jgi:Ni/Fe-hydrogenase subunit HybB-like protein